MPQPQTNPNAMPVQEDGERRLWAVDQRDPRTLGPGLMNDGRNLRFTDGLPTTRPGVTKPTWANMSALATGVQAFGPPFGVGAFEDPASVEWQFAAAGGRVWRTRPMNVAVTVPLPTGVAILSRCKFVQAFDQLFLFRGRYLAPLVMSNYDTGFTDILPQYTTSATYNAAVVATGQPADEMAYGPYLAVTGLTRVGNVATVVTAAAHGYITGADVNLIGATPAAYNGRVNITVVDEVTFTFAVYGSPSTPPTGTTKVSNMSNYWQALGSQVTLATLVSSGTFATATTSVAHGFSSGQYVTITGATPPAYNGTYPITVVNSTTFTFVTATTAGASGTGTILAQTSIVFAGQTPDSNPEAWQRTYNVLPNAETALFVNNLLLVPTAFEPASVDNYATFNGGTYQKVDFLVATNFDDFIHFSFVNEFRINQGGAGEIVDLFDSGNGTVIVVKTDLLAVVGNLTADLSQVTLDTRHKAFGGVGIGASLVVGSNAYVVAPDLGLMVIRQTDLGVLLSVNVPLSASIQPTVDRLDWTQSDSMRLAAWNNKLYWSAALNTGEQVVMVYDFISSIRLGNNLYETGVTNTGWAGTDTGSALTVVEWFKQHLNGRERLFFLDAAGFVNLMEESNRGDQVPDLTRPLGLGWEEIQTYELSRMYEDSLEGLNGATETGLSLMTWNPCYSIDLVYAGMNSVESLCRNVTKDNTKYYKPFNAPRWNDSNVNDDWDAPFREDYRWSCTNTKALPAVSLTGNTLQLPLDANTTYTVTAGPNTVGLVITWGSWNAATNSFQSPIATHVLSPNQVFSFTPIVFPGNSTSMMLQFRAGATHFPSPMAGTTVTKKGILLGSGMGLVQMQDALDQRRSGNRQGKGYQIRITSTTGRIRTVGWRVSSEDGINRKGILI